MKGLALIIAVAVLIEGLVEYAREIREKPVQIATLILGIGMAFLFKADMFAYLNIDVNVYADYVLTGIIMSRGSNYAHQLSKSLLNGNVEEEEIYIATEGEAELREVEEELE